MEDFNSDDAFKPDPQQELDYETIRSAIKQARPFGLQIDVLYEACNQIKSNPNITISDAFNNALWEWDL